VRIWRSLKLIDAEWVELELGVPERDVAMDLFGLAVHRLVVAPTKSCPAPGQSGWPTAFCASAIPVSAASSANAAARACLSFILLLNISSNGAGTNVRTRRFASGAHPPEMIPAHREAGRLKVL
jgi:hypothetical protein